MIELQKKTQLIPIETVQKERREHFLCEHDRAIISKRSNTYLRYCYFIDCRLLGRADIRDTPY